MHPSVCEHPYTPYIMLYVKDKRLVWMNEHVFWCKMLKVASKEKKSTTLFYRWCHQKSLSQPFLLYAYISRLTFCFFYESLFGDSARNRTANPCRSPQSLKKTTAGLLQVFKLFRLSSKRLLKLWRGKTSFQDLQVTMKWITGNIHRQKFQLGTSSFATLKLGCPHGPTATYGTGRRLLPLGVRCRVPFKSNH